MKPAIVELVSKEVPAQRWLGAKAKTPPQDTLELVTSVRFVCKHITVRRALALVHRRTVRHALMQARCETFNGEELLNLEHLAGACDSCTDVYMRFGLEGGKCLILERKQVLLIHIKLH